MSFDFDIRAFLTQAYEMLKNPDSYNDPKICQLIQHFEAFILRLLDLEIYKFRSYIIEKNGHDAVTRREIGSSVGYTHRTLGLKYSFAGLGIVGGSFLFDNTLKKSF